VNTLTVTAQRTCSACPSQWQVSCGEHAWYVRYRWGHFAIYHESADIDWAHPLYEWENDDEMDGYMSDDDMVAHFHTARLVSPSLAWDFGGVSA
jgi:hypothetical protein